MSDHITEFTRRFTWAKKGLAGFQILRDPGPVEGDCKSFALTISWIMAGRSVLRMIWQMLTLQTVIWIVWSGEGHAETWVRGKGWICNIYPWWKEEAGNRKLIPLPAFLLLLVIAQVMLA